MTKRILSGFAYTKEETRFLEHACDTNLHRPNKSVVQTSKRTLRVYVSLVLLIAVEDGDKFCTDVNFLRGNDIDDTHSSLVG